MQLSKLSIKRVNVDYVVAVATSFYLYFLSFLSYSFVNQVNQARQTKTEYAVTSLIVLNFDGNIIRNRKQVVLTVCEFLAIFAKRIMNDPVFNFVQTRFEYYQL